LNISEIEKRNYDNFIDQINVYTNCQESEHKRLRNHLEQEKSVKKSYSESAVCY